MAQLTDKLSRRTFVKGAAAAGALAGIAALGGCASEQKAEDKSEAKTDAPKASTTTRFRPTPKTSTSCF